MTGCCAVLQNRKMTEHLSCKILSFGEDIDAKTFSLKERNAVVFRLKICFAKIFLVLHSTNMNNLNGRTNMKELNVDRI